MVCAFVMFAGYETTTSLLSNCVAHLAQNQTTFDHLKSNPDTKDALMGLAAKNAGGLKGMMKSVLGDKSLSQAAVDYISKNPDLLQKAMGIVGM